MVDFDYAAYVTGTTLHLENRKITDCRIADIQCENIEIKNCQFENVIFENYFKRIGITTSEFAYEEITMQNCTFKKVIFRNVIERKRYAIEKCEFVDCEFFDKFLQAEYDNVPYSVLINMNENAYRNCLLEDMSYIGYYEQCDFNDNCFENCHFKNVLIDGDISVGGLTVKGGKMEQIKYKANILYGSSFSELEIEDSYIWAGWDNDRMNHVAFKNVTIVGFSEQDLEQGNCRYARFTDCSTDGLTLKKTNSEIN